MYTDTDLIRATLARIDAQIEAAHAECDRAGVTSTLAGSFLALADRIKCFTARNDLLTANCARSQAQYEAAIVERDAARAERDAAQQAVYDTFDAKVAPPNLRHPLTLRLDKKGVLLSVDVDNADITIICPSKIAVIQNESSLEIGT